MKVGDRVRITGDMGPAGLKGQEATLVEIDETDDYEDHLVLFDEEVDNAPLHDGNGYQSGEYPNRCWWFGKDALEVVE